MKIRRGLKLLAYCVMFFAFSIMRYTIVNATEIVDLPYVLVEGYRVTNEKIIPGEEFTLTLTLKNSSETLPAHNVMISVSNPSGIIPIYGEVSQQLIHKIEAQESIEVSFDYTSMSELVGDYLDFYIMLEGAASNSVSLRIPMGVDSPFTILAFTVPATMYAGEMASTNVSFKVLGDANVRNVYLELQMNDTVISKSAIGTLTPGLTRTHNLSPMVSVPGNYEAKLILYYDDEADQTQSVVAGTASVTVEKKPDIIDDGSNLEGNQTQQPSEEKYSKEVLMGIEGIIILLVCSVLVWIMRKKK